MTQLRQRMLEELSCETLSWKPFDCTSPRRRIRPTFSSSPPINWERRDSPLSTVPDFTKRKLGSAITRSCVALRFFLPRLEAHLSVRTFPFRAASNDFLILSPEEVAQILTTPPHLKSRAAC